MGLINWLFGDSEAAHRRAIDRARGQSLITVGYLPPPPNADVSAARADDAGADQELAMDISPCPTLHPSATLVIEQWWCQTTVTLEDRVMTPLGGRVTCLRLCLDIEYFIADRHISIMRADLAATAPLNVAADRRGEAWWTRSLPIDAGLYAEVARADMNVSGSRLRRVMYGKWSGMLNAAGGAAGGDDGQG